MRQFIREFWRASLLEARWLIPAVLIVLLLMRWAAAQAGQVDLTQSLLRLLHSSLYDPCGCGF